MEKIIVLPRLLCVLVIVCNVVLTSTDGYAHVDSYHITAGSVMNGRQRRSWTSFQFAWKKILKDAFPFISQRSLQVYTKRGDVDQAVDDFYALHPTDVISDPGTPDLLVGNVGSYTIRLFTGPTDPGKSRATLTLQKRAKPNTTTAKFIYYEDL